MKKQGPLLAMADQNGELLLRHEGREERVSVRRLLRGGAELYVVQFVRPVVEGSWPCLTLVLGAQKKKRANGARGLSQNKVAGL